MKYADLAELYDSLGRTTKKLEKRDILADFYKGIPVGTLYKTVMLSMGTVFSKGQEELGVARELVKRAIAKAYGAEQKEVTHLFKETGDLGLTAEHLARKKKQKALGKKDLTVDLVFEDLRKLPDMTGSGSQQQKINVIVELLAAASPKEARYIVRTIIGDMRIGVAAGIVRDALAKAFDREAKDIEKVYDIVNDFGKVAEMAKKGNMEAEIEVGRPIRVMLADRASDLKEALGKFERPILEIKYDGLRVAVHKDGNNVKIFSRRLEDVTKQFPDIANMAKKQLRAKQCIVEGEALAVDPRTKSPRPFQVLSKRIQRKYHIEKTVKEIPVQVNLFDLLYKNGKNFMEVPFKRRWSELNRTVKEIESFRLADHIQPDTFEEAQKFYKKSLALGQEGVIVKNADAYYKPGKRVGYWLKVKEILEPLDLVIVGAEWGEGKRANWLGSLILAARDVKGKDEEKFVETGRMGSGLTEEQMETLTKILKKLITEEKGKIVKVKPEVVIEIGYEEIQKSPKYPSGYALRFPRLLRIRMNEKKPEDADTVKTIEKLFRQQKGRK